MDVSCRIGQGIGKRTTGELAILRSSEAGNNEAEEKSERRWRRKLSGKQDDVSREGD